MHVAGAPKISCFPVFVPVFLREETAFLNTADGTDALRRGGLFNNESLFFLPPGTLEQAMSGFHMGQQRPKVEHPLNQDKLVPSESNSQQSENERMRMGPLRVSSY